MKIAIDSSALVINRFSGLARVVKNLIQTIPRIDSSNHLKLYFNYFKSKKSDAELCFPNTVNRFLRLPRRLVENWWNYGWPPFDTYLKKVDVFHSLHIDIPPTKKMKTVLTVHDCRYLAYAGLYSDRDVEKYKLHMETSLKRADMVVTVSEFTRSEILKYFKFPIERIKVIYNGFNPIPNKNGKFGDKADNFIKENSLPASYLFCIGALDPRKNVGRLLEAVYWCREVYKDFPDLLLAGINFRDWSGSDLRKKTEKIGLSNHIHLCGVLERDLLIGLIQKSHTLCYPSLYEGFGFPPLEAMSLGVPVLAGKKSSIPEIAGDSACLVDPESVEDIANGLIRLVYDQNYRSMLIESGYRRIGNYSWESAAENYLRVYREALAS